MKAAEVKVGKDVEIGMETALKILVTEDDLRMRELECFL